MIALQPKARDDEKKMTICRRANGNDSAGRGPEHGFGSYKEEQGQ